MLPTQNMSKYKKVKTIFFQVQHNYLLYDA